MKKNDDAADDLTKRILRLLIEFKNMDNIPEDQRLNLPIHTLRTVLNTYCMEHPLTEGTNEIREDIRSINFVNAVRCVTAHLDYLAREAGEVEERELKVLDNLVRLIESFRSMVDDDEQEDDEEEAEEENEDTDDDWSGILDALRQRRPARGWRR